jgi:mono/diheme cytochrome c family protein
MRLAPACLAITLLLINTAMAASPAERRGRAFAKANCARCHSIDRTTLSRLAAAPPFRALHKRYPIETLAEAFAEGIYTGHSEMPAFELEPNQINDLLSFLKSLE